MSAPLINGKEIVKACVLTLVLIPVVVFFSAMISGILAEQIIAGKAYHRPTDVAQEVSFAVFSISIISCLGFAILVTFLAIIPPRILPHWASAVICVMMLGCIALGNKLYHNPGSVPGLLLMIFLLTIQPGCAACFVFRIARANQPTQPSLVKALLSAFSTILLLSVLLALVTVFIGGVPNSELPSR